MAKRIHFATDKDQSSGDFLNSWLVYNSITIRSRTNKKGEQPFEVGEVEQLLVGSVDCALVAENMLVASRSLGLGGVMIGGIRNNPEEVAKLLNLPEYTFPIMGLCIGYPDQNPDQKPRLPKGAIVFNENYDTDQVEAGLKESNLMRKLNL